MMELLIVRHAIACERDAKRWPDDGARPLSPRGVMRARRAAAGLKKLAVRPVRVLASPLVRTAQTAAVLTQYAGWPRAIPCPLLVPGGSPQELLALLARTRGRRVAVIGHQPDLGRLIAVCLLGSAGSAVISVCAGGRGRPAGRLRPPREPDQEYEAEEQQARDVKDVVGGEHERL